MNTEERTALESWVSTLAAALDLDDSDLDIDAVLDLAGVAARSVVRPAAPVTTFLVGLAAGRASATGTSVGDAIRDATARAEALAASD